MPFGEGVFGGFGPSGQSSAQGAAGPGGIGPGAGSVGGGPAGAGANSLALANSNFLARRRLVSAPPLASAATISDPTTDGEVLDTLRRREAQERNPVSTTGTRRRLAQEREETATTVLLGS
jgi:hypothetical protein